MDSLFEQRCVLDVDGMEVHLIHVWPCHQVGDTVVHVPKEGGVRRRRDIPQVHRHRLDRHLRATAQGSRSHHLARRRGEKVAGEKPAKARQRTGEYLFPKMTTEAGGRRRLVDQPPALFHVADKGHPEAVKEALEDYRLSLPKDRGVLFERCRLEDIAVKVVGIGSVGTRCFVGLFVSAAARALRYSESAPSPSDKCETALPTSWRPLVTASEGE